MSSDLEMLMEEEETGEQDSVDLTAEDCFDQTSSVVVNFEPSTVLKTVKSSSWKFFEFRGTKKDGP